MLRYAKIISKQCVYTYPSSLHQPLNTYNYYIYFINTDTKVETLARGLPPQLVGRTRSLSWATWLWRQTLTQGASQALPNKYCRLDKIGTSKDARSLRKLFFPWTGSTSSNHVLNFSMLFKFSLKATSTYITLRGGLDYLWRMRGKEHYFALQWKKAWAPGTDQLIRFKTLSKVSPYFPIYTICCIYNIYTICIHYVFKININKQYLFRQTIYAICFPYKQYI